MLTKQEAEARVTRAVARLDAVRPDWVRQIDPGTLTLHDPCGCIVGQLTPMEWCTSFEDLARETFHEEAHRFNGFESIAAYYGCELVDRDWPMYDPTMSETDGELWRRAAFQPLQDAWIAAIAERLHPDAETRSGEVPDEPIGSPTSVGAVREDVGPLVGSPRA